MKDLGLRRGMGVYGSGVGLGGVNWGLSEVL